MLGGRFFSAGRIGGFGIRMFGIAGSGLGSWLFAGGLSVEFGFMLVSVGG